MPLLEDFPEPLAPPPSPKPGASGSSIAPRFTRLKTTAIKMQLKPGAGKLGRAASDCGLEFSISQGYQGIFEERAPSPQPAAGPTTAEAVKAALETEAGTAREGRSG